MKTLEKYIKKFMDAPSVLIRFRLVWEHPEILSNESIRLLDQQRNKAMQKKDHQKAQSVSSEILTIKNCLTNDFLLILLTHTVWTPGTGLDWGKTP